MIANILKITILMVLVSTSHAGALTTFNKNHVFIDLIDSNDLPATLDSIKAQMEEPLRVHNDVDSKVVKSKGTAVSQKYIIGYNRESNAHKRGTLSGYNSACVVINKTGGKCEFAASWGDYKRIHMKLPETLWINSYVGEDAHVNNYPAAFIKFGQLNEGIEAVVKNIKTWDGHITLVLIHNKVLVYRNYGKQLPQYVIGYMKHAKYLAHGKIDTTEVSNAIVALYKGNR